MREMLTLAIVLILGGMMAIISPGGALPIEGESTEEDTFPLFEGFSDKIVGIIIINPYHSHYTTSANVGKQNGKLYYELMAYNPSGVPTTITWGMKKPDTEGNLRFNDKFDSNTSAWTKTYGLSGVTYSVRPINST